MRSSFVAETNVTCMSTGPIQFHIAEQVWPLDKPFRIARGTRTEARVLLVTATRGEHRGRGEAVPARRYNETVASATVQLEKVFERLGANVDRNQIQKLLPPGPARNALDCALWDLEAKE